jgi:hypothetical protein
MNGLSAIWTTLLSSKGILQVNGVRGTCTRRHQGDCAGKRTPVLHDTSCQVQRLLRPNFRSVVERAQDAFAALMMVLLLFLMAHKLYLGTEVGDG